MTKRNYTKDQELRNPRFGFLRDQVAAAIKLLRATTQDRRDLQRKLQYIDASYWLCKHEV